MYQTAINFIKQQEGCRLIAYPDPATGGMPYTIGYGQTHGIDKNTIWTQEEADEDLAKTVSNLAVKIINVCNMLNFRPNENQLAALLSFTYNLGYFNFLRLMVACENPKGTLCAVKIPDKMLDYDYAAGKPNKGLLNRRMREGDLFLKQIKV